MALSYILAPRTAVEISPVFFLAMKRLRLVPPSIEFINVVECSSRCRELQVILMLVNPWLIGNFTRLRSVSQRLTTEWLRELSTQQQAMHYALLGTLRHVLGLSLLLTFHARVPQTETLI